MYYIRLEDSDSSKLIYYCRKCGDENDLISEDNMCVSFTNLKREENKYYHIVNKYTKLDPTLPRINNIECPNEECSSRVENPNERSKNEIIYMRYDNEDIKYVYICVNCDSLWTTNKEQYEKIN
jgi:DNA-directed RNA polymerase subunit RPC12/RpoP